MKVSMLCFLLGCLSDVLLGHYKDPAVQRYMNDITSEIAHHLETITSSLSMYIEIGMFVKCESPDRF